MKTIAILNEKGGTAKTTTSVSLAAALGDMGKRVLLVDLDGQAASSRWLGVEGDTRLADALLEGSGLEPIENVIPGVSLAPASGKLDSISHNLRPTQGSQLRRVLAEVKDRYDYILIDCPPSLGNRLIGNALLAASHAIVPVETSILALDGLRILLTMLDDIRQGFEHEIELIGALGCRFNSRTRLSRLVLAELHRALPGKVFGSVIHETVRMQECPAAGKSILEYAPDCSAAADYRAVAAEVVNGIAPCAVDLGASDLVESDEVDMTDRQKVVAFRQRAGEIFCKAIREADGSADPDSDNIVPMSEDSRQESPADAPPENNDPDKTEAAGEPSQALPEHSIDVRTVSIKVPSRTVAAADNKVAENPPSNVPVRPLQQITASAFDDDPQDEIVSTVSKTHEPSGNRDNMMVGAAATIVLGILSIGGWLGFKALAPAPESASAKPAPIAMPASPIAQVNEPRDTVAKPVIDETQPPGIPPIDTKNSDDTQQPGRASIVITADNEPEEGSDAADNAESVKRNADSANAESSDKTSESTEKSGSKTVVDASSEESTGEKTTAKDPTTQPASKDPTTQPAPRVAKAEDYPSGLTLTGVMYGRTSRRAIISGTVVYEGDKVQNARVVKILPDSVEIEANGFRFLLGTGPKPVWLKATQVVDTDEETKPLKEDTPADNQE